MGRLPKSRADPLLEVCRAPAPVFEGVESPDDHSGSKGGERGHCPLLLIDQRPRIGKSIFDMLLLHARAPGIRDMPEL
jgi:hypothetical protein